MRTIAHISDIHFGTVDDAVADALVREINDLRPSLVVASGDFTQRARAWQYRAAAEFLGKLPRPQLVVPGNHDIPLSNVLARFFWPLRNYTKYISRDLRPVFRDDEMLVVGLNTARSFTWNFSGFWKDGRISEEQLLDIRLRACEQPQPLHKIVVTHHPFIPPPKERPHGIVHGAKHALAEMEACGVDIALAGHLHMGYSGDVRTHHEAVRRSIISIQAGTATSNRRRGEPNAYNLIKLDEKRLSVQVRAWNGRQFGAATDTHFARVEGMWVREAAESKVPEAL